MGLELTHRVHADYLEITTSGTRTKGNEMNELVAIWKNVFVLARRCNLTSILAHIKEEGRWPLNAQINFGLKMEETGVTKSHRVAGICYTQQLLEEHDLFIKYGRAKGFEIQIFQTRDAALDWLLHAKPGKPEIKELTTDT